MDCFAGSNPPSDSVGMIQRMFASASTSRKAAFGVFNVNLTVAWSGYSTLSTKATWVRLVFVSAVARPHEYFTSSVVTARPLTGATLWNLAPGGSVVGQ